MGEENIAIETEILKKFQQHARLFEKFGKQMENYLETVGKLKGAMEGIHKCVLEMTEEDWPRVEEFNLRLEDQSALWTVMSDDIQKMGSDFEKHGKRFQIVQESLKKRKEKANEYIIMKKEFEKTVKNSRIPRKQKIEAKQELENKEFEYIEANEETKVLLQENIDSKRDFVASTYGKFLGAHTDFCEQSLQVHKAIPDILSGFEKKPNKTTKRAGKLEAWI